MKLNRKWLLLVALVLSVTMATTGTLAYLTDRDSEANVFTMGNVEIDLNEEFEQGSELIPGVDIVKEPTITNTGKNDAYVWATIAIPSKLDSTDASKNIVHFNYSKDSVGEGYWNWQDENGNWMVKIGETVDESGINYNVYTVLYESVLKAGETTAYPVIEKVYMDDHIDIDTNGDVYHVEGGVVTGPYWNLEDDGNPVIYVSAYAIQTEGFEDVWAAYDAYTAQWGNNGTEYEVPSDGETDNTVDLPFASVSTLGANDTLTNADGDVTVVEEGLKINTSGTLGWGLDLGKIPLDVAYQFEPTMSLTEAQESEYADWHADFVVSIDKEIPGLSLGLAGYYDAWCQFNGDAWVLLADEATISAGTSIRLVEMLGRTVSYEELCEYGNDGIGFLCGAAALKDETTKDGKVIATEVPSGTTLTVELRLYEATGSGLDTETGEYITTGTYRYTFE